MPFLDEDYMAAVLRLPPAMRMTSRVHRHILARNNPVAVKDHERQHDGALPDPEIWSSGSRVRSTNYCGITLAMSASGTMLMSLVGSGDHSRGRLNRCSWQSKINVGKCSTFGEVRELLQ